MSRWLGAIAACIASAFLSFGAGAHEIRPAYLQIEEAADGIRIYWKQPVIGELALPLRPVLSSGWLDPQRASFVHTETYLSREWHVGAPAEPLAGQTLTIEGLAGSLTDVLVRIVFADGTETVHLVRPEQPVLVLPAAAKATPPVAHYLALGVEHIWTGIDHLLFVLALLLIATRFADLLKTITAFTVAHSVTLGAAALGWVHVPIAPVEAVIALSIVYLAVELVYLRRGRSGLAHRHPWAVASIFGLLHGFGFAGALSEVGLPADSIPLALLFFNLGIELGQVAFVCGVLLVLHVLARRLPRVAHGARLSMPHIIGGLAAFWFIERTLEVLA